MSVKYCIQYIKNTCINKCEVNNNNFYFSEHGTHTSDHQPTSPRETDRLDITHTRHSYVCFFLCINTLITIVFYIEF